MSIWSKIGIPVFAMLILLLPLLAACGDNGEEKPTDTAIPTGQPTSQPPTTEPSAKKTKIVIGNHTDLTGPASVAMQTVNMGLEDIARYYNDNNLIPGVEVEVVNYDGMLDPSRDIPGWQWLKERGADVIMAWYPSLAMTLRTRADADEFPVVCRLCAR